MKQPITFKVSVEEKKIIDNQAKKYSLPTGTFIRFLVLKKIQEETSKE
jgi:hypothetical protein